MTDGESNPKDAKATKVAATAADTLVAHLATKTSNAKLFMDRLNNRPSKELLHDDLEEAKQAVRQDPTLLGRVAELARFAQSSPSITVRGKLLRWAAETIEGAQPGLEGWKPGLPDSSGSLIAQLAKGSTAKTADPNEKQAADALLQIGVAVLMGQYGWTPATILSELKTGFDKSRHENAGEKDPEKPDQLVTRLLRKASARQLQEYASIALLLNKEVEGARERARQAEQLRQEQYDRYLAAKAHGDRLRIDVAAQEARIVALEARNEEQTRQLESIRSGAAHGQTNFRARYRSFLDRQLTPKVTEAADALEGPEPWVDIAAHRLKSLKSEIAKEVTWLNESSE